jgi:site-specific DNA recombinase
VRVDPLTDRRYRVIDGGVARSHLNMKKYLGYIRVSTAKQGERGVSLQEQREAIGRYAERNSLAIMEWFEERETAAKRGRPIFTKMLKLLKRGAACGVIIHKIDRSARNLKDWADLGQLIDEGVDVRFSQESLDLNTRGGRLSADIQAVVAADFIRNLREETRKGFYGRLKQGLYPLPAPVGYMDQGKGKNKTLDPKTAPLVRRAFELYASGGYNMHSLLAELHRLGLQSRRGGPLSLNGLSTLLNNPFYAGVVRIHRTGETFVGTHEPLLSISLFNQVQAVLRGKINTRSRTHIFLFRRMLNCKLCGRRLIGETQKGHVYYRCHTGSCATKGIREEDVDDEVRRTLSKLQLEHEEVEELKRLVAELRSGWSNEREATLQGQELGLGKIKERLDRLTDAYIDRLIDRPLFEERREALVFEQRSTEERIAELRVGKASIPDRIAEHLELSKSLYPSYIFALPEEKREILKVATSNLWIERKNVAVELQNPFLEIANRSKTPCGRTWAELLISVMQRHFQ